VPIFAELHTQLTRSLPSGLSVTDSATLDMAATRERYVADLLVTATEVLRGHEWLLDPADVELVAEIVSSHGTHHDRVVKPRGYAASGVPVCLLADSLDRTVTLFSEPAGDSYQRMHRVSFGETLALPEPYGGKIDTAEFS
jgi:Uma2 family endonuclease